MSGVSNLMPQSNKNQSNMESTRQSTEDGSVQGQYITEEDPNSGYQYVYFVIGKNFKVLISCAPLEKKSKDDKKTESIQKQSEQGKDNGVRNNPYRNTEAYWAQKKQQKPYLKENTLEKIRVWEQCCLLDKHDSQKFDAKG